MDISSFHATRRTNRNHEISDVPVKCRLPVNVPLHGRVMQADSFVSHINKHYSVKAEKRHISFSYLLVASEALGISIESNFAKRRVISILKRRDAGELVIHIVYASYSFHFRRVYEYEVEVVEESRAG